MTRDSLSSVFVQDDLLVVDYNSFDERTILESELPVPQGDSTLEVTLHQVEIQLGLRSRKDSEATAKAEMSRQ